jgi:molecular chaperone GrpE
MENQQEKNSDVVDIKSNVENEDIKTAEPDYEERIANLNSQIEELQDKLLRTVAESENTRKRLEKTIDDAKDYAIFSFAKDLLAVSDNLARALEHKPQNVDTELGNIITGVEMTKSELNNILKKHNVESIEPLIGEKFDYNKHHAIMQLVTDKYDSDSIVAVMQSGYKIKDRLLRPAVVQVSKNSQA